jgi:hypothetical protein
LVVPLLIAAGTYVLKDIYDNWGAFKAGFADGQKVLLEPK